MHKSILKRSWKRKLIVTGLPGLYFCLGATTFAAYDDSGAASYGPATNVAALNPLTMHATDSALNGWWLPVPDEAETRLFAHAELLTSPELSLTPSGGLRLLIEKEKVLLVDENGERQLVITAHPKLQGRPGPQPGETFVYWEARTLVVKHISADGQTSVMERYDMVAINSLMLSRRTMTPGNLGTIRDEEIVFRRQLSASARADRDNPRQ